MHFRHAIGGMGHVVLVEVDKTGRRKPKWRFMAAGFELVQAIIAMLWPWLGEVKRGQARVALKAFLSLPRALRRDGVRFGRPLARVCKRGHDLTDARVDARGARYCRQCEAFRHGGEWKGGKRSPRRGAQYALDRPIVGFDGETSPTSTST